MAAETIRMMYCTSQNLERGWFNVIHPVGPNGTKPLQVRNPSIPPSTSRKHLHDTTTKPHTAQSKQPKSPNHAFCAHFITLTLTTPTLNV